jgi:acyl-CoA hydrolase
MKTTHTFLVMPTDLNASHGTLFGGKMMAEMDLAAAIAANRFAADNGIKLGIVTAAADMRFRQPVYQGDFVTLTGYVRVAKGSSIFVDLVADIEVIQGDNRGEVRKGVATADFHMVTIMGKKSAAHGIEWLEIEP